MEKDDEVKGAGNSYESPNRVLDPRSGRWLSIDPVTHHSASPYCSFDNNPIYIADPSGADGGGTLQGNTWFVDANLKFQFDPRLFEGMSQTEIQNYKSNYIQNAMNSVSNAWHGQVDANGNQVDASYVNFEEVPWGTDPSTLGQDDNLITVGSKQTAEEQGISSFMIDNEMSHVNGLGKNAKTAFFFASNQGNETGHELGHMLGLTDRYAEALAVSRNSSQSYNVAGRFTIPLQVGDESSTGDYQLNVMSTSGSILTPNQIGIAMNRESTETQWQPYGVLLPNPNSSMNDLPGGFNYRGIDVQNGGMIGIDVIKKNLSNTTVPMLFSTRRGGDGSGNISLYFTTGNGNQRRQNKDNYDEALDSQTR